MQATAILPERHGESIADAPRLHYIFSDLIFTALAISKVLPEGSSCYFSGTGNKNLLGKELSVEYLIEKELRTTSITLTFRDNNTEGFKNDAFGKSIVHSPNQDHIRGAVHLKIRISMVKLYLHWK